MAYCYDGKTYETIKEMAEEYGIDRQRIYSFRRRGWSLEDAMQMCINDVRGRGRLFEYNGKLYRSPKALAEEYGLPYSEARKKKYTSKQLEQLEYVPSALPRYPMLQSFDFTQDSMDILLRYEELFQKQSQCKREWREQR